MISPGPTTVWDGSETIYITYDPPHPYPYYQYYYDKASNVIQRTSWAISTSVTYTPDALNRITELLINVPTPPNSRNWLSHEHYTYDGMNRLKTIGRNEDNLSDVFGYNLAGELTSAQYGVANVPFGQDGGDPTEPPPDPAPDVFPPADDATTDVGLDAVTQAFTVGYTLDKCGNRTAVNVNSNPPVNYHPNELNQYDIAANGATIYDGEHELATYLFTNYNYIGDTYLASVMATTGAQDKLYFGYDALGRCIKHTFNSTVTYYVYDGEHLILEYDGTNQNIVNALYGREMDEVLARNNYGMGQYFVQDRLGNTLAIIGGGGEYPGKVLEWYRYDAFGAPSFRYVDPDGVVRGHTATGFNNRFLFNGREYVPKFGFYEYRARAYRPGIGRFMSEDPKGFDAGDYNLYRYCKNDPWDLTDPMGLDDGPFESNLAALRFLHATTNPASIKANKEFRTKVYQNPQTHEYFTNETAKGMSHKVATNGIPKGMVETADHHTHAAYGIQDGSGHVTRTDRVYKDNMNSDHPSGKDERVWHAEGKRKQEYTGAVSTPGGKLIIQDGTNPNSKPQEVSPLQPQEIKIPSKEPR